MKHNACREGWVRQEYPLSRCVGGGAARERLLARPLFDRGRAAERVVLHTLHFILCTVYFVLYTLCFILCTVLLYTLYFILCTVLLYTLYFILCTRSCRRKRSPSRARCATTFWWGGRWPLCYLLPITYSLLPTYYQVTDSILMGRQVTDEAL